MQRKEYIIYIFFSLCRWNNKDIEEIRNKTKKNIENESVKSAETVYKLKLPQIM